MNLKNKNKNSLINETIVFVLVCVFMWILLIYCKLFNTL